MATPQLPLPLTTTRKPTKPTTLPPSEALLWAPLDTYPISRFSCWPSAANNFNSLSLMCCQLFLMGALRAWSGGRGRHLPTYWNILFAFCLFLWARVVANSQLIYDPLWSQQILFRPHKFFHIYSFCFCFHYILFIFLQHPFSMFVVELANCILMWVHSTYVSRESWPLMRL